MLLFRGYATEDKTNKSKYFSIFSFKNGIRYSNVEKQFSSNYGLISRDVMFCYCHVGDTPSFVFVGTHT